MISAIDGIGAGSRDWKCRPQLAVAMRDIALVAVAVENAQGRQAEIPDSIMQGKTLVVGVAGNLPVPESVAGPIVAVSITNAKQDVQRAIRAFWINRPDMMDKIARGLHQHGH
jgi:hypothetical protein